jgi:hypothetical protein
VSGETGEATGTLEDDFFYSRMVTGSLIILAVIYMKNTLRILVFLLYAFPLKAQVPPSEFADFNSLQIRSNDSTYCRL